MVVAIKTTYLGFKPRLEFLLCVHFLSHVFFKFEFYRHKLLFCFSLNGANRRNFGFTFKVSRNLPNSL